MTTYIQGPYRLHLEPVLVDVTTIGEDRHIDTRPVTRELHYHVNDEAEAIEAIKRFFNVKESTTTP